MAMADWSALEGRVNMTVFHDPLTDEEALVRRLSPFQAVVVMRERTPLAGTVIERLPRLELLVTTGPVNRSIDLDAAARHRVTVCGTGFLGPPALEQTWALILGCMKQLTRCDRDVKAGAWQTTVNRALHGKRLGVLGLGRYGAQTAALGRAFGMDVAAWSENLTQSRCDEVGATYVAKEALFATSDVVCVHLQLSPRTTGLVGAKELRAMKPSAYIVNTSRGAIIEEGALVEALRQGWIAGAGLDVFDIEPLPEGHPLASLPNVILSPHMGYVTEETYRIYFSDVVEDIVAYLDGRPVRLVT